MARWMRAVLRDMIGLGLLRMSVERPKILSAI
jgi:hypothetical protein